jgi:hypothetical protein
MSSPSTHPPQSDLDRWLASLGFVRGNPFATAEADQERILLPEFFVNVDGYERIKGDRTILVFAPRGGGKSALRVVLASQSAPIIPDSATLTAEYLDFDSLIAKRRNQQSLAIEDHVYRLLRTGVKALLDALCGEPAFDQLQVEAEQDRQHRAVRATALSGSARSRLARMLHSYYPSLLYGDELFDRICALDRQFSPSWSEFTEAVHTRRLRALIDLHLSNANAIVLLLADLNDYLHTNDDADVTPVEHLAAFARLARAAHFTSVQFLLDRLDEHQETANDAPAQADILEPLLAHLPLLELSGLAFKFFLSREAHQVLLRRVSIRRDRLTDQAVTVHWGQAQLKKLLDTRLAVYSDGQVRDLVQLCQDMHIDLGRGRPSYLLGKWIEEEMIQLAQGSPRRLLVAAQLLCQAHMEHVGSSGVFERPDWEKAKERLTHKMPPILRVRQNSPLAQVGEREVRLTAQQHSILLTLAGAQGKCGREQLVAAVWEASAGVSNAAVDQAIGRLRERLGDHPDQPIYLETIRDGGFSLRNYELEEAQ